MVGVVTNGSIDLLMRGFSSVTRGGEAWADRWHEFHGDGGADGGNATPDELGDDRSQTGHLVNHIDLWNFDDPMQPLGKGSPRPPS